MKKLLYMFLVMGIFLSNVSYTGEMDNTTPSIQIDNTKTKDSSIFLMSSIITTISTLGILALVNFFSKKIEQRKLYKKIETNISEANSYLEEISTHIKLLQKNNSQTNNSQTNNYIKEVKKNYETYYSETKELINGYKALSILNKNQINNFLQSLNTLETNFNNLIKLQTYINSDQNNSFQTFIKNNYMLNTWITEGSTLVGYVKNGDKFTLIKILEDPSISRTINTKLFDGITYPKNYNPNTTYFTIKQSNNVFISKNINGDKYLLSPDELKIENIITLSLSNSKDFEIINNYQTPQKLIEKIQENNFNTNKKYPLFYLSKGYKLGTEGESITTKSILDVTRERLQNMTQKKAQENLS